MAAISLPQPDRPHVLVYAEEEASPLDVDRSTIVELYKRHGALLLRGFDTDLAQFRAFTAQFCATSVFNESPGRRVLDQANNIQSVNLGSQPFPLHPELSREPWKPDVCFFSCQQAPRRDGMTTVCDGVELVRRMPAAIRDGLAGQRLVYVQATWPALLRYWLGTAEPSNAQLLSPPSGCPYSFARAGGQVLRVFARPALHTPMFTDAPAFGNFLLFARYFLGIPNFPILADGQSVPQAWTDAIRAIGESLSAPIAWEKGDILMLDNTRFMHGRTAISEPAERLIASYFGYLNFAVSNPEEPVDPPWRRPGFRPPEPVMQGRRGAA